MPALSLPSSPVPSSHSLASPSGHSLPGFGEEAGPGALPPIEPPPAGGDMPGRGLGDGDAPLGPGANHGRSGSVLLGPVTGDGPLGGVQREEGPAGEGDGRAEPVEDDEEGLLGLGLALRGDPGHGQTGVSSVSSSSSSLKLLPMLLLGGAGPLLRPPQAPQLPPAAGTPLPQPPPPPPLLLLWPPAQPPLPTATPPVGVSGAKELLSDAEPDPDPKLVPGIEPPGKLGPAGDG